MRVGVRTLVIAVVGLCAIAIAVSGCTGDSDAEAESPPATTTEQVETQPPAKSAADMSKFRAAFKETFGERPWYRQITGMKMTPKRSIEVRMVDPEKIDIGTICEAVFSVADNAGVRNRIDAVHVIGSDGSDGGCA